MAYKSQRSFINDSLGRIHSCFVISDADTNRVCYGVFEPGASEVWRDTVPGSHSIPGILVDGSRVHIVIRGEDLWPDYIQYDLEGNITVPPVDLAEDLVQFQQGFSLALDGNGDLYAFLVLLRSYLYLSLFKIDGETGDILIEDMEIWDPGYSANDPIVLPTPSGDMMYLLWRNREETYYKQIYFAVIDTDGNFIETPYSAYDYSDEEQQQLSVLDATCNDSGDVFAIWSAYFPEVHPNAYHIPPSIPLLRVFQLPLMPIRLPNSSRFTIYLVG